MCKFPNSGDKLIDFPADRGRSQFYISRKSWLLFPTAEDEKELFNTAKYGEEDRVKTKREKMIMTYWSLMHLHVCPLTILRCKTETDGLKNLLDHTWLSFIGVAFTSQRDYGELFWNIILWYCGERLSKVCWLSLPYPSGKFDNFVPTEENGNVEYMRLTIALFLSSFILQSELHSE